MHARLYNEAIFSLRLRPRTPLLIKAGRDGDDALDPTLPAMSFIRTSRPDVADPEVFIPGASLRGVLRSHSERLVRSIGVKACDPTRTRGGGEATLPQGCFTSVSGTDVSGPRAYRDSCAVCRMFGNTVLAARLRIGDMHIIRPALLDRRYGVAIDRVTGAASGGKLFDIEIMTDGEFEGRLTLRNFTLGQFGLLAGALLDMNDGLVPMGYGKSRGLGRVELRFAELRIRSLRDPAGALCGVGSLAGESDSDAYKLPDASTDRLDLGAASTRERGYYVLQASDDEQARGWLEQSANHWVEEMDA